MKFMKLILYSLLVQSVMYWVIPDMSLWQLIAVGYIFTIPFNMILGMQETPR